MSQGRRAGWLIRAIVRVTPWWRRVTRRAPVLYRAAQWVFDRLVVPASDESEHIRRTYRRRVRALAQNVSAHELSGGELTNEGEFFIRTADGLYLYFNHSDARATYGDGQTLEFRRNQRIEPVEAFVLSYLRSGMTYVDVGANNGYYYSLKVAKFAGCQVVAFEPDPGIVGHLRRNIARNNVADRVQVFECALSDREGTVVLTDNRSAMGYVTHDDPGGGHTVRSARLDDLLASGQLTRVDLLKVDIEGGEHGFLLGAQETLRTLRPVLVIEVIDEFLRRSGSSADEVIGLLSTLGYRSFEVQASHDLIGVPEHAGIELPPGLAHELGPRSTSR